MILLADFCNKLAVHSSFGSKKTVVRKSNLTVGTLKYILNLGFLQNFSVLNFKYVKVFFKLLEGRPVLRGIFCILKPTLKMYLKKKQIEKKILSNKGHSSGFSLLSTSYGLRTDIECILSSMGGLLLVGFN